MNMQASTTTKTTCLAQDIPHMALGPLGNGASHVARAPHRAAHTPLGQAKMNHPGSTPDAVALK